MRVAVYYAPAPDDPLHRAGAEWLGRDPETGAAVTQPPVAGIADATASPRVYGLHCTLKPPMRLAAGTRYPDLVRDTERLARGLPGFDLPQLEVADLHGFLALRETAPCPALHALADRCVTDLDAHRAEPDPAELARRRTAGLSAAHDAMLVRWGYPHVFETWFFHMTLTCRMADPEQRAMRRAAETHFAAALARSRRVTDICLFTQAGPDASFLLAERFALSG